MTDATAGLSDDQLAADEMSAVCFALVTYAFGSVLRVNAVAVMRALLPTAMTFIPIAVMKSGDTPVVGDAGELHATTTTRAPDMTANPTLM